MLHLLLESDFIFIFLMPWLGWNKIIVVLVEQQNKKKKILKIHLV